MSCRVYLGRLPYGTRERDVEKFFRGFGKLREINLKNGYGFVVSCFNLPNLLLLHVPYQKMQFCDGNLPIVLRAHGNSMLSKTTGKLE